MRIEMTVVLLCSALGACVRSRASLEEQAERDLAAKHARVQAAFDRCRDFLREPSACVKDSDCTSVMLAHAECVISKARLPSAAAVSKACETVGEAGVASFGGISSATPICEQQACRWRESSTKDPLQGCLERHLERFPDDRKPIVVEVAPLPEEVSAVAAGDDREVARCLEDRLLHLERPQKAYTLRLTPGVRAGPPLIANQPVVNQPIVVPTTTKGQPQKEDVRPLTPAGK